MEQRSQKRAGGDTGNVGRPLRHVLNGCGMTAHAQLVLDARAATGRSVQVIKPFMHSSTRPQAFSADSLATHSKVPFSLTSTPYCLFPQPKSLCITSSHSDAKEGMRSIDGFPELQLATDPLRFARPPSSSPTGDDNKSESDFDKLRSSPRSAGLTLITVADSDETLLPSGTSVFGFCITLVVLSGMQSAIVVGLQSATQVHPF
ncbi:hypothetical protein ATANTOWER_001054 [Ataeniobius toweri]|uniref:Uncharacterized protein n=2 Tax=Goodeidae TaxID=28758 RepID=A0ABU7C6T1_9TELE|nr:hypothetical protein [Ataeniobius toweri]